MRRLLPGLRPRSTSRSRIRRPRRSLREALLQPPRQEPGRDVEDLLHQLEDVLVAVPVLADDLSVDAVQHLIQSERYDDDVVELAQTDQELGDQIDRRGQVPGDQNQ